jgi:hypothetical protein
VRGVLYMAEWKLGHEKEPGEEEVVIYWWLGEEWHRSLIGGRDAMQTHAAFSRGHLIWDLIMLWVRAVDYQKKDIVDALFYPISFCFSSVAFGSLLL